MSTIEGFCKTIDGYIPYDIQTITADTITTDTINSTTVNTTDVNTTDVNATDVTATNNISGLNIDCNNQLELQSTSSFTNPSVYFSNNVQTGFNDNSNDLVSVVNGGRRITAKQNSVQIGDSFLDGSLSEPLLGFYKNPNTGLYLENSGQSISVSANGVKACQFNVLGLTLQNTNTVLNTYYQGSYTPITGSPTANWFTFSGSTLSHAQYTRLGNHVWASFVYEDITILVGSGTSVIQANLPVDTLTGLRRITGHAYLVQSPFSVNTQIGFISDWSSGTDNYHCICFPSPPSVTGQYDLHVTLNYVL